ncbi:MAG TPA: hypothetical protein DCK99_10430 [Blastocatellia bacterium]|nr:hypothetical protein [Blastocatellia bacterium]
MRLPSSLQSKITPSCATAIVVSLLPLFYFLPATRGRLIIAPDDGTVFNVPLRLATANLIRSGYLPLWNPYIFCGMPLHGAAQAGVLFPLNWFYLAFNPALATNLMMLATYVLAALGAYVYAHRRGSSIAGAALTSVVWQWSGFLVAQIGHTNIVHTAALLPWLLWAIDGYGMLGKKGHGVLLAALIAVQVFAGHQQTLFFSLFVAGAYAVVMSCARESSREARSRYLWSLAFIAAGLALAAVQILPTVELLRNSLRAEASYDFFTSFSLPPRFLWTFFAPYILGGGDGQLFRAPYVGPAFYGEYIGYVGLAAIMLATLSFVFKRDALTKFWTVVAIMGATLALGRFLPLNIYRLPYHLPVLNLFRVPARHLMEVDFALAVLAGRGLTAITSAPNRSRVLKWTAAIGIAVVLLTMLAITVGKPAVFHLGREGPPTFLRAPELFLPIVLALLSLWAVWLCARRKRWAMLLLFAVVALDLNLWGQSSGWRLSSPPRDDAFWQEPAAIKFLREREGPAAAPYRVLTLDRPFTPDFPLADAKNGGQFVLALQPDISMMYGVENAAGYDGFGLARYSRLAGDMKVWGELSDPARSLANTSREFDLLNVRYLLTKRPATAETAQPKATEAIAPLRIESAPRNYAGYPFAEQKLNAPYLDKGARLVFSTPPTPADNLALLTSLAWSEQVATGTIVARVLLRADDGENFTFDLRAGQHTSDWAYDRADIRKRIRHARAPVATSYAVEDSVGKYQGHTYAAGFALPKKATVVAGEIQIMTLANAPDLGLQVESVSLIDKSTGTFVPLQSEALKKTSRNAMTTQPDNEKRPEGQRWQNIAELDDVVVYENKHVLPRAWLATGSVTLPDEQALNVIRSGKLGGRDWNPRQTVLVESPVPGNATEDSQNARAEITRNEPNRVDIKTTSNTSSILVLAENHYPGWRARVDGNAVDVLRVNYNLRGVALPAGEHHVEFVYRPKSVLIGLLVSLVTMLGLVLWWLGFLPRIPFGRG